MRVDAHGAGQAVQRPALGLPPVAESAAGADGVHLGLQAGHHLAPHDDAIAHGKALVVDARGHVGGVNPVGANGAGQRVDVPAEGAAPVPVAVPACAANRGDLALQRGLHRGGATTAEGAPAAEGTATGHGVGAGQRRGGVAGGFGGAARGGLGGKQADELRNAIVDAGHRGLHAALHVDELLVVLHLLLQQADLLLGVGQAQAGALFQRAQLGGEDGLVDLVLRDAGVLVDIEAGDGGVDGLAQLVGGRQGAAGEHLPQRVVDVRAALRGGQGAGVGHLAAQAALAVAGERLNGAGLVGQRAGGLQAAVEEFLQLAPHAVGAATGRVVGLLGGARGVLGRVLRGAGGVGGGVGGGARGFLRQALGLGLARPLVGVAVVVRRAARHLVAQGGHLRVDLLQRGLERRVTENGAEGLGGGGGVGQHLVDGGLTHGLADHGAGEGSLDHRLDHALHHHRGDALREIARDGVVNAADDDVGHGLAGGQALVLEAAQQRGRQGGGQGVGAGEGLLDGGGHVADGIGRSVGGGGDLGEGALHAHQHVELGAARVGQQAAGVDQGLDHGAQLGAGGGQVEAHAAQGGAELAPDGGGALGVVVVVLPVRRGELAEALQPAGGVGDQAGEVAAGQAGVEQGEAQGVEGAVDALQAGGQAREGVDGQLALAGVL